MEFSLLSDMIIVLGLSIVVLFLCNKLYIPSIVGLLLTGALVGPEGFALITGISQVNVLAEIGVILLLFSLGIEFSLKNLVLIKRTALMGGTLQVLITIVVFGVLAKYSGLTLEESIFIGFIVSLSSTAIVLKLLQDRAEVDTPQGRTIIGILIYQDIIIVVMMLFSPLLAGTEGNVLNALSLFLLKSAVVIILIFVFSKWVLSKVFYYVASSRSRELFLLSVVFICIAVAWFTHAIGLSLALGAFLAGLIISNSEYSHEALGNILPFKDVFTSFFFVSIGMLLNVNFLLEHLFLVFGIAMLVIVIKAVIAGFSTFLLGFPVRVSILVGLSLCQVGEFSFVLSKTGIEYNLISDKNYQIFLNVSILTMIVTPFIVMVSQKFSDIIIKIPMPKILREGFIRTTGEIKDIALQNHLIVIGFGVNGRNVTRSAKAMGIPYNIIEMNPETVRSERVKGEPIIYGDATREAILEHVGIKKAKVLVSVIHDAAATRRIVAISRKLNKNLYIIARTRFILETSHLFEIGADEVIPEEFETSVEIFVRVLTKFDIPKSEIDNFVEVIRADGYKMFRSLSKGYYGSYDYQNLIPDGKIETYEVSANSLFVGKTIGQIEFRKKYGVTVLAIRRGDNIISNPDADTEIYSRDILIILGYSSTLFQINQTLSKDKNDEV